MQTQIQKWGNSLGVQIPVQLAKQLQLHPGSPVTVEIENERIVIQPPKYDLESMLKNIAPDNLHHVVFDDQPTGNEEW
jgi:antitoxin MazE